MRFETVGTPVGTLGSKRALAGECRLERLYGIRSQNWVVGAGFEPAYDFRRTVLQTVAINHSATPPWVR
jgi:hypothetical protein